jgi:hypothetical protein
MGGIEARNEPIAIAKLGKISYRLRRNNVVPILSQNNKIFFV